MPSTAEQIKLEFFQSTRKVRCGKGGCVTADHAKIKPPQGRKFMNCMIEGIAHYTRIDCPDKSKGGVVIRRRIVKDPLQKS